MKLYITCMETYILFIMIRSNENQYVIMVCKFNEVKVSLYFEA